MTWLHRLSHPRIRLDSHNELALAVDRYQHRTDAEVHFIDLTSDLLVPVAMVVIRRSYKGKRVLSVGTSAKSNLYSACEKAFAEAYSGYNRLLWQLEHYPDWRPAYDGSNLTDWEWHGFAYAFEEYISKADFLTAAGDEHATLVAPPAPSHRGFTLSKLTQSLRDRFGEIVAVDLTTREIQELGLSAVKVLIPAAIPLSPDHRFQWLGCERLYSIPRKQGYSSPDVSHLNPDPHPFA